jgi:uncharacterized protein (DUF2252 family)
LSAAGHQAPRSRNAALSDFFRATYYRWLQQAPYLARELDGPVIAAVGDLHLENFGTWQTSVGRSPGESTTST